MADFESIMFDEEELHTDCTVQIWRNTVTGEESVGWWENGGLRMDKLMNGLRSAVVKNDLTDAVLSWLFIEPDEFGFLAPQDRYGFHYLPGGAGREELGQLKALWQTAAECFGDGELEIISEVEGFREFVKSLLPEDLETEAET